jgi:hypothetical protein
MIGLLVKVNSFAVSGEMHRLWNFCLDCRALFRSQPPGQYARSAGQRSGDGSEAGLRWERRTWALATTAKERGTTSVEDGIQTKRKRIREENDSVV